MSFISIDVSGPYGKTDKANQYVLPIICMLTNYVLLISIKIKTTEVVINAYLKTCIYATFGGCKYIFSDRGREVSSKQFTWLAKELGFTKVYISPYMPTGNSVVQRMHSYLKASLQKILVIIIQIGMT